MFVVLAVQQSLLLIRFLFTTTDPMPDYADSYYGFTQYTIELNELTDTLSEQLPVCDTRFRPDQK